MKRYTYVGKLGDEIPVLTRFYSDIRVFISLRKMDNGWWAERMFSYHPSTPRRCSLFIEGLGINGPVITVRLVSFALIGELVTNERTGRNIIWVNLVKGGICRYEHDLPMSTRNQAVKIASSKWFSLRRST